MLTLSAFTNFIYLLKLKLETNLYSAIKSEDLFVIIAGHNVRNTSVPQTNNSATHVVLFLQQYYETFRTELEVRRYAVQHFLGRLKPAAVRVFRSGLTEF